MKRSSKRAAQELWSSNRSSRMINQMIHQQKKTFSTLDPSPVCLVTGNTRGIGRHVSEHFASKGYRIVITGKTKEPHPTLPNTIYTTAQEIEAKYGVDCLPVELDVRSDNDIERMALRVEQEFGRVDLLINNASALYWQPILKTPMSRYDLMNDVNSRGTFAVTRHLLPLMQETGGDVITFSPPIDLNIVPNKIGYCISKFGMTLVALGVAEEMEEYGIKSNAVWPSTLVESYATINFGLGSEKDWRSPQILADVVEKLVEGDLTGQALIDEDYLRDFHGYQDEDFIKYRCDPEHEPEKMADAFKNIHRATVKDKL